MNRLDKAIITFALLLCCFITYGQDLYKTPSGKRYHLSTCKMVENVSTKIVVESDISKYQLEPCKICKPPYFIGFNSFTNSDKSVGQSKGVQCKAITKAGTRCKHYTKLANGYCYQHKKS